MLVLSRRLGESIVLPECDLKITVLALSGGRVRLGIAGPPEVKIHREEVWRRLCEHMAREETAAAPT
jgi:carbon storage regulator